MAGKFFQPDRSAAVQQSSGLPAALNGASEPELPVSYKLFEKKRLEVQHKNLHSEWETRTEKVGKLRQARAIESGTATSFQLDKQIEAEEAEIQRLANQLSEIERALTQMVGTATAQASSEDVLPEIENLEEEIGHYQGGKLNLDLTWQPPASMAILRLEQTDQVYVVRAHHRHLATLEEKAVHTTLPMPLGTFRQSQPWTIDTVGYLEGYQPKDCLLGKTLKWLRYLCHHEPNFVCLVIAEPSTSPVPWELLNLNNQALGVTLQTVRVSAMAENEEGTRTRTLEEVGFCQGRVMVYIDEESTKTTSEFGIEFQSYHYEMVTCCDSDQILRHLQQTEAAGLIMMTDISLQKVAVDRRRFFFNRTKVFQRSSSLVMLQTLADNYSRRFLATELLEYGVGGVLGMLETVEHPMTQQIIRLFLKEYSQATDVPIPELLRRARQTIAQRLETELTNEIAQLYLATCMYAYYGHPMNILQLTPAEDMSHD